MRMIARRLNAATSAAARRSKVDVIDPQRRGTDRGPCSGEPWATGFPSAGDAPFVPYHPTLAGMAGIAEQLDSLLRQL
jgi:hypothetical protein